MADHELKTPRSGDLSDDSSNGETPPETEDKTARTSSAILPPRPAGLPALDPIADWQLNHQLDVYEPYLSVSKAAYDPSMLQRVNNFLTAMETGVPTQVLMTVEATTVTRYRAIHARLVQLADRIFIQLKAMVAPPSNNVPPAVPPATVSTQPGASQSSTVNIPPAVPLPPNAGGVSSVLFPATPTGSAVPGHSPLSPSGHNPFAQAPAPLAASPGSFSASAPRRETRESEVPRFDGVASNWPEFQSLFHEKVVCNPLNSTQWALYLLRRAVPEECRALVQNQPNALAALSDLATRYNQADEIRSEVLSNLIRQSALKSSDLVDFKRLRDVAINARRLAQAYGPVFLDNVHSILCTQKLGPFRDHYLDRERSENMDDLVAYLEHKVKKLTLAQSQDVSHQLLSSLPIESSPTGTTGSPKSKSRSHPLVTTAVTTTDRPFPAEPCAFCSGPHLRRSCRLSRRDRRHELQRQGKCFGCFKSLTSLPAGHRGHCSVACKFCHKISTNTQVCECRESSDPSNSSSPQSDDETPAPANPNDAATTLASQVTMTGQQEDKVTYLPTLRLTVRHCSEDASSPARALLDPGSTVSYISDALVTRLDLPVKPVTPVQISVLGGSCGLRITQSADVQLTSRYNPRSKFTASLLVVPGTILTKLPYPSEAILKMARSRRVTLSDQPETGGIGAAHLLIGQDLLSEHFLPTRQLNLHPRPGLTFTRTKHGWVVQGCPNGQRSLSNVRSFLALSLPDGSTSSVSHLSPVIRVCQDLTPMVVDPLTDLSSKVVISTWHEPYDPSIKHITKAKRYPVALPWLNDQRPDPNHFAARASYRTLKKRLERKGCLLVCSNALLDLLKRGRAELLEAMDSSEGYYLPHSPVFQPRSVSKSAHPVSNATRLKLFHRDVLLENQGWHTELSPAQSAAAEDLLDDMRHLEKWPPPRKARSDGDYELRIFEDTSRVRRVNELANDWYYIPTETNPANIISRGLSPHLPRTKRLWIDGPPVDVVLSTPNQLNEEHTRCTDPSTAINSGDPSVASMTPHIRRLIGFAKRTFDRGSPLPPTHLVFGRPPHWLPQPWPRPGNSPSRLPSGSTLDSANPILGRPPPKPPPDRSTAERLLAGEDVAVPSHPNAPSNDAATSVADAGQRH